MPHAENSAAPAVHVYRGDALARYGFGDQHPFGNDRHQVFQDALAEANLGEKVSYAGPRTATIDELSLFHDTDYINFVSRKSVEGHGFLDGGDTPVFPGMFEVALDVVGTTLAAVDAVMTGNIRRAFVPIAGLHHAGRDYASGFCVFNDCSVAIEYLRKEHGLSRIAYVDIDVHHGDGVFYAFESDPDVPFADIHEDGRYLYPGTGRSDETGKGDAVGSKLNIPLAPGASDDDFATIWPQVEAHIRAARPEFVLLQCGADSLAGDPLAHLSLTENSHARAALSLCRLADDCCSGRIVAMGGGGYNRDNLAAAWTAVVRSLATAPSCQV